MFRSYVFQNSGIFLYADDATVNAVAPPPPPPPPTDLPEPTTLAMVACGLAVLGWRRRAATTRS